MDPANPRSHRSKSRQSIAHVASMNDVEYDKENATADLGFVRHRKLSGGESERKKLRSKSLGPGGLEALKESGGNLAKASPSVQIKSILKPTVPLTPPKAIPAFDESRKRGAGRSSRKSPKANVGEELLIDFSTPAPSHGVITVTGAEKVQDPFSPFKKPTSQKGAVPEQRHEQKQEHEQEALIMDEEAEELRRARKKAILEQRAARRKSMADRRVSFAPEATLHTWKVIETAEDSTSSSASNSTRRQSSMTGAQTPNKIEQGMVPSSDPIEPPRTPPKQIEEPLVKASPAQQRDLHQQKRRRRSSGLPLQPSESSVGDDPYLASPYSGSSAGGDSSPSQIEESVNSSEEDGDTAMSMVDATSQTIQSELSSSSSTSSLDDRLRKAAVEAGTRGIDYDENGDDLSMELAEGTITNAFQPWAKGHLRPSSEENGAMQDQGNVNPFSPAFKLQADATLMRANETLEEEIEEEAMEMTVARGGILSMSPAFKFRAAAVMTQIDESTEEDMDGMTMDMTVAEGGILSLSPMTNHQAAEASEQAEEFTEEQMETVNMDMTVARGVIFPGKQSPSKLTETGQGNPDNSSLSPVTDGQAVEAGEQAEDTTEEPMEAVNMDMTIARGFIFATKQSPGKHTEAAEDKNETPRRTLTPQSVSSRLSRVQSPRKSPRSYNSKNNTPRPDASPASVSSKLLRKQSLGMGARSGNSDTTASPAKRWPGSTSSEASSLKSPTSGPEPADRRIQTPQKQLLSRPTTTRSSSQKLHSKSPRPSNPQTTTTPEQTPSTRSAPPQSPSLNRGKSVTPLKRRVEEISIPEENEEQEVNKITLQEFLNMTSIHFIELSTTKRRHTVVAPTVESTPSQDASSSPIEACFVAAATTLPLLELYQHATRELKSYISSGRKIIRTIEQETLHDQPPMFREYSNARPDVKMVMDNQFRNAKAKARLQSKEGWYAWRRQLVEGLRNGLEVIKAGMDGDAGSLTEQEHVLAKCIPVLLKQFATLEDEAQMLQQRAEEFESVDHESLNHLRSQLESADVEVAQKSALFDELQQQMAEKAEALSAADELKTEFRSQIAEAQRIQDECRGWKAEEVRALKRRVESIETETGWSVVTAEQEVDEGKVDFGPALTMRYKQALRLFLYPAAFGKGAAEQKGRRRSRRSKSDTGPSAPISLTYAPSDFNASPWAVPTTQQRFFLQLLQGHLHARAVAPKGSVLARSLLTAVSQGWELSTQVAEEIRLLEIVGITNVSILGDDKLGVKCMVMLPEQGRMDVQFVLTANATSDGSISTNVHVEAAAKYGPVTTLITGNKATKVRDALYKQSTSRPLGEGAWAGALRGLDDWISSQRKGRIPEHEPVKKPGAKGSAPAPPLAPPPAQVETSTPAPLAQRKELKKPVPIEEVMEEAAARQGELRKQEEMLVSPTKTPAPFSTRHGALRRSP